jgi:hypothetical protein
VQFSVEGTRTFGESSLSPYLVATVRVFDFISDSHHNDGIEWNIFDIKSINSYPHPSHARSPALGSSLPCISRADRPGKAYKRTSFGHKTPAFNGSWGQTDPFLRMTWDERTMLSSLAKLTNVNFIFTTRPFDRAT